MFTVEKNKNGKIQVIFDQKEIDKDLFLQVEKLKKERLSLKLEIREIQKVIQEWQKRKELFWTLFRQEKQEKEKEIISLKSEIDFWQKEKDILQENIEKTKNQYSLVQVLPVSLKRQIEFLENIIGNKKEVISDLNQKVFQKEKIRKEIEKLLGKYFKLRDKLFSEAKKINKVKEKLKLLEETYLLWQKQIKELQNWSNKLALKEIEIKEKEEKLKLFRESIFSKVEKLKLKFPNKKLSWQENEKRNLKSLVV